MSEMSKMSKRSSLLETHITAKKGKVNFTVADENTPYIINMIKKISNITKEPFDKLLSDIKEEVKKEVDSYGDSHKFYDVQKQNVIESVVFNRLKDVSAELKTTKFDEETFYYMFRAIIAKNRSFLKIRDIYTGKKVNFNIILTPAPSFIKQPSWVTDVDTAAASPEGDVIFNKKFAQQLIDYAELKGEKPEGSMYKSNGGRVPDSYAYLEFLILHEIYHIVHSDHFHQVHKKGMTGLMQNYLGDFITNYNLVKAGYKQLPIGLFSNDFNYDHYDSMNDMQNDIIKEFKKLSLEDKEKLNSEMDDHMDKDHDSTNDQQAAQQDGQDGQYDQDIQDGKQGDQDGQNGQQSDQGSLTPKDMDKSFKESDKQMPQAKDDMSQEELNKAIEDMLKEKKQEQELSSEEREKLLADERKNRENRNGKLADMDKNYIPVNWEKLIKLMIPKPIEVEEESMTKMHRRTRGQLALGNKITSVKAGVIKDEKPSQDLLFILDSSGSMAGVISNISQDLIRLINKNKSLGIQNAYIIRFDSKWDVYKLNIDLKGKKHTYQTFKNREDILNLDAGVKFAHEPRPLKNLFEMKWGLGTDIPKEIPKIIKYFQKRGTNQVLFTDTDIISSGNLAIIASACKLGTKKPYSFNMILDSKASYDKVANALGSKYKYMSYLK